MKQFNLKVALKGAKIQTREGKNARIICTDCNSLLNQPIIALVEDVLKDGNTFEHPYAYSVDGSYNIMDAGEDKMDLVMVPTYTVIIKQYDCKEVIGECCYSTECVTTIKELTKEEVEYIKEFYSENRSKYVISIKEEE